MTLTPPRPRHRWFAYMYAKFIEPSDKQKMAPRRRFAAGGAEGRVLELGAGTGSNLEFYEWSKIDSLELTEPDPFMVKYIAPKLEALAPEVREKIRVSEAPAEVLPFADGEFDCAVVTLVLCTVSHLDTALAELRRVLEPNGEMRLVEHVKGSGKTALAQKLVQPVYGKLSGDCQLTRNIEAAIEAAGFDLQVTERTKDFGALWPAFAGVGKKK